MERFECSCVALATIRKENGEHVCGECFCGASSARSVTWTEDAHVARGSTRMFGLTLAFVAIAAILVLQLVSCEDVRDATPYTEPPSVSSSWPSPVDTLGSALLFVAKRALILEVQEDIYYTLFVDSHALCVLDSVQSMVARGRIRRILDRDFGPDQSQAGGWWNSSPTARQDSMEMFR